jgi:hypothetical protein
MTLDLATIPADLLEPTPDHAGEPANDPPGETAAKATSLPAQPANPIPASTSSAIPQEIAVLSEQGSAYYPNDHLIHALYGGFMGMPELPGDLLRANLWDTFLDVYTDPDLRHHFAHIVIPTA